MNAIRLLLGHSFFIFKGAIIKQAYRFPQGGADLGILANPTLHRLETKAISIAVRRHDYPTLKAFKYTYRYLDGILVINYGAQFEGIKADVYLPSLVLNKTNESNTRSEFLDVNIAIKKDQFDLTVFDKTIKFSFEVIKLPHFDSLMPRHIILNAVLGKLCVMLIFVPGYVRELVDFAGNMLPGRLRKLSCVFNVYNATYSKHY